MEQKLAEWRAQQAAAEKKKKQPSTVSGRWEDGGVFSGLWRRLRPGRRAEAEQRESHRDPPVKAAAVPGLEAEGSICPTEAAGCVRSPASGEAWERSRCVAWEKEENDQNTFKEKSEEQTTEPDRFIFTILTVLKFLLWLVLLGLFIELEFGLVYFVLSLFYWIYVGTREPSEKEQGEVSAYSVFNPGCKAIEGSLTAEQFERELQYRPLAGR
ncbi:SAYSvFN domain-containing protein 1 [Hypanus sabinus]|uniref:SAYSvFN domain-containing protein 1 n=1 Tax=Hypanus sabinus TaxID=79690 RepID=UPI0028C41010|nr:SAYSvFN domain-containing protein 1 [Hypanus sabinus]